MQIWFRFNSDSGLGDGGSFSLFNSGVILSHSMADTETRGMAPVVRSRNSSLSPASLSLSLLYIFTLTQAASSCVLECVRGAQQPLYITCPEAGLCWQNQVWQSLEDDEECSIEAQLLIYSINAARSSLYFVMLEKNNNSNAMVVFRWIILVWR